MFNQSVDNLPPNLTHLTFGDCNYFYSGKFNQPLNNLPSNLQEIFFSPHYQINNLQIKLPFGCKVSVGSYKK
jgi:hypothetical protein